MSRMINRMYGRVYGWFDSKDARQVSSPVPAKFRGRARLAMLNLEDRVVPATFTVTNIWDNNGANPVVGVGTGTFRQALIDANYNPGPDTIVFNTNPSAGTDFSAGRNIIAILGALPSPSAVAGDSLTIIGPGADKLLFARGTTGAIRFLNVTNTSNLTTYQFENFSVSGFSPGGTGGAILISGGANFTLNNLNISGNTGTTGGGIQFTSTGTVAATVKISNSTFAGNIATSTLTAGGAGIAVLAGTNQLSISNSTFAGNSTAGSGGAINLQGYGGTGAALNLTGSTVTANIAANATAADTLGGGGISRGSTATAVAINLTGSIVAGNVAGNGRNDISQGTGAGLATVNATNSMVQTTANVTFTTDTNNKNGVSPNLTGQIGYNNGGSTPTLLPLAGSQAIGNGGTGVGNDQNGVARGTPADIGAAEVVPGVPFALASTLPIIQTLTTTAINVTVNYYDDVAILASSVDGVLGAVQLRAPNGTTLAPLTASTGLSNGPLVSVTYTFLPGDGDFSGNDNGLWSLEVMPNVAKNTSGTFVSTTTPTFEGAVYVGIAAPRAMVSHSNSGATGSSPGVGPASDGTSTPYTFNIVYTSPASTIKYLDIGAADVVVTGPGGTNVMLTGVTTAVADAATITATYSFAPPGGTWNAADNGIYSINMVAGQVRDNTVTGSLSVPAVSIGRITVSMNKLVVTNTGDDAGINPGMGTGTGTLRQAIVDANLNAVPDIIVFSDGTGGTTNFNLPGNTITLGTTVNPLLGFTGSTTINGTGPANLIIQRTGANAMRIFDTSTAHPDTVMRFSNMTITGASTTLTGGGININDESVTVDNCVITGNFAGNGAGIAVTASPGQLTLINSTISSNTSSTRGGGIHWAGGVTKTLSITGSTISNNTANGTYGGGGGVFLGAAVVTVNKSTISGNVHTSSQYGGGAFYITGGAGTSLSINNSTLSGNSSAGGVGGGALYNWQATSITVSNSTIFNNTASNGGAIRVNNGTGTLNIYNSTIANNVATGNTGGIYTGGPMVIDSTVVANNGTNFNVPVASSTANYSAWDGTFAPGTGTNNLPNQNVVDFAFDADIGSNGGPTMTLAFPTTSILTDRGRNNAANPLFQNTDQRGGGTDVVNYPRSKGVTDIGAYESGVAPVPAAAATTTNITKDDSTSAYPTKNHPYQFTVTYTDALSKVDGSTVSGANKDATIQVTGPNGYSVAATFVSVTPSGDNTPLVATYQIAPPDGVNSSSTNLFTGWDASDNGTYFVNINANTVANTSPGNFVPAGQIGSFTVNVPRPTAVATAANINKDIPGGTYPTKNNPYRFTVSYADTNNAIQVASIDGANKDGIVFTKDKFDNVIPASFVSVTPTVDGTPLVATYEIAPPGGNWDSSDNYTYTIQISPGMVLNTVAGDDVPGGNIGSFTVNVPDPITIYGHVFFDANYNGIDNGLPTEPGQAGVIVYDDVNNNGKFDGGTGTFPSTNVPVTLPDNTTVTSTLTLSGLGSINDVNVNLTMTHTWDADVIFSLVSPAGTTVTLANQVGSSGDNFINTTFDDEAATLITAGAPPFTGSFQPVPGLLSAFDKQSANGTWTLVMQDKATGDTGNLTSWSLILDTSEGAYAITDANGDYVIGGLTAAAYPETHYFRETNLPGSNVTISPTGGVHALVFNAPTDVFSGINFGNNDPNFPTPSLTPVGPVTINTGNNPFQFTVTFTGQATSFVSAASVRSTANKANAITVTGPGGYSSAATWVSDDSGGTDAQVINAVYQIATLPVNGFAGWNAGDNGAYNVNISAASTIENVLGFDVPVGKIDSFQVNVPIPTASATGANVTKDISTGVYPTKNSPYRFTVTYTDPNGGDIAVSTITAALTKDVTVNVLDPLATPIAATFVSVAPNANGNNLVATYEITAPGGSWTNDDNGTYTIASIGGVVKNTVSDAVAAGNVGSFTVNVPAPVTVYGHVYLDADYDGIDDGLPGEPGQAGVLVYDDLNNNGKYDGSNPPIASTNVPIPILDNPNTTTSTLTVSGLGTSISDVNINFSLNHTWDDDLDVVLITPAGTTIPLFNDVGSSGDNMINITLDDEALISIQTFTAGPPTTGGTFMPSSPLSAADGQDPNGNWTLSLFDDVGSDSGTLLSWSLTIATGNEPFAVTDANGDYVLSGLQLTGAPPENHFLRVTNLPSGQVTVAPASGFQTIAINAATDIFTGVNFGTNTSITPDADLVAIGPVTVDAGNNPFLFTVKYSSPAAVPAYFLDYTSIQALANKQVIQVTGPGGFTSTATYQSDNSGNANQQVIEAVYKLDSLPLNGFAGWNAGDNGLYTVEVLPASTIDNAASILVPAGPFGTFTVNVPIPTATPNAANVTKDISTGTYPTKNNPYRFEVTFTDPNGGDINVSTITAALTKDVTVHVVDPLANNIPATFVSVAPNANGNNLVATYEIAVPGNTYAGWDSSDNGTYTIVSDGGVVFNTVSDAVAAGNIGSFTVNVPAPGTVYGRVYYDQNSNGVDNGEPGQAGVIVYDDLNNNGVLDQGTVNYPSANVPVAIPDFNVVPGVATSTLTISGGAISIGDVNVNLDITHTYDNDLILMLISPAGTTVTLSNRRGNPVGGDNFTGTTFDDEAATTIAAGLVPYTGSFSPDSPLSDVDGQNANGTWTLMVTDNAGIDVGTINSWSLDVFGASEPSTLTDANGDYVLSGLVPTGAPPENHFIRQTNLPSGMSQYTPAANAPYTVSLTGGNDVFTGRDFGNVNATPSVSGFLVNQGYGSTYETQRSRLINIVVNFASPVDATQFQTLGNVTLTSTAGPSLGNVVNTGNGLIVSPASGMVSSITLTFANVSTPGFIDNASLADGRWQLGIQSAGNYTSTAGDTALRRLFGDFDNNGTVEGAIDFPAFGNDFNGTFGAPSSPFDFNNDGTVEGSIDFPAFGNNFNVTL